MARLDQAEGKLIRAEVLGDGGLGLHRQGNVKH